MDAEALGSTGNLLHWRRGVNVDNSVHDSIVELVNGDLRLALFPPKLNDTWLVGRKSTRNVRALIRQTSRRYAPIGCDGHGEGGVGLRVPR